MMVGSGENGTVGTLVSNKDLIALTRLTSRRCVLQALPSKFSALAAAEACSTACCYYLAAGVIGEFLFLYLQDLGGSETLMGLTLTVTCISEVPMFHFQPQILRVVSVHSMLHFVMWTYALRMGLYALVR